MSDFKWRHFEGEVILWAVRWYCRYGISYRDLEQMMGERGVPVDNSTIFRWVQRNRTTKCQAVVAAMGSVLFVTPR
jgi:IS6 family transposase